MKEKRRGAFTRTIAVCIGFISLVALLIIADEVFDIDFAINASPASANWVEGGV